MLVIAFAALLPFLAAAGVPVARSVGRSIAAHAVEVDSVRVDGVLDESAWRDAPFSSGFLQKEPEAGAPASRTTEVAVLVDGDALYVGARLSSNSRAEIGATLTPRDDLDGAEYFVVSLDTFGDRRTAYSFAVTAAGVRVDWYHPADDEDARDFSFNPVWQARTRVGAHGWTVELRIPFSQLRFNRSASPSWGINFHRHVPSLNEDDFWVHVPRERTGWASWFGTLEGLHEPHGGLRLELVPSVVGIARAAPGEGPPLGDASDLEGSVGVDARVGLGPALTLEATAFPDFSQIEADPAQINLTAFEPFLDERRPFFSEGGPHLVGGGPEYFYSRRIGASPLLLTDESHVVLPASSTVLGAAKLTGTLVPGLAVGALAAVTDEAFARITETDGTPPRDVRVSPLSGYGVARVQRQLGGEGTVVGFSLVGVGRRLRGGLVEPLPQQAWAGGADWDLRFGDDTYSLSGYVGGSHVAGSREAMRRLHEGSAHYFQRPDQSHVRVDPEARSLSGYAGSITLSRIGGAHWRWQAGASALSPGFELNDTGRLERADSRDVYGSLQYVELQPGSVFRRWEASLGAGSSWDHGGHWQDASAVLDFNATWPNFWFTDVFAAARPRTLSPTLTRGGPLMANGPDLTVGANLAGNPERRARWSIEGEYFVDTLGGSALQLTGGLDARPTRRLVVGLFPSVGVTTTARQYVGTYDGGPPETFGQRYVFATADVVELSTELRASYFLAPGLSVQLYAQPFASRGRYRDFGELAAARSQDLRAYGSGGTTITRTPEGEVRLDDGDEEISLGAPDFNVRSFRSSAVLRWEWRPGSTLTLVWQHDRFLTAAQALKVGPASLADSFDVPGGHTLAIKLGYWVPVD